MYRMIYADARGRFYEHPGVLALGRTGDLFVEPDEDDMIELPNGASLVLIPGGHPAGMDKKGKLMLLEKGRTGEPAWAVGALLPQGYTRTLLPAYRRRGADGPLPLFGYAAVAWRQGKPYVAARRTDDLRRWNPESYNTPELPGLVHSMEKKHPGNRIIGQLSRCALEYSCFTAQNIFYRRWEGGIPVSPVCNARCLGCISLQPAECCPSPQSRINFSPTPEEVAEIAIPHLDRAAGAIISFGQGCEGEPALTFDTVAGAIRRIRKETANGTINMNSNAGHTIGVTSICAAGLDSLRVSIISAREEVYNAYYRPRDYKFGDVLSSIVAARSAGIFVSLNLLLFPGLTDRTEEAEALVELINKYDINMVQLRNLNIDPDFLMQRLSPGEGELLGVPGLIKAFQKVPGLKVGNFSHPVR
ncbi:MAG: radical SAM protein [Peptococcaceae bacterium BRH_c4b]|nr:MAG: radical SAM protein [Peptococcaceae bacterium BRH_c4b]